MYKYKITGKKEWDEKLEKLGDAFGSKEMMDYLGDKCERVLYKITNENLSTIEDLETSEYARNHKKEVVGNKIILSNDTMADLSELSPETLKNYPNGFSISHAVEYGTGVVGLNSEASTFAPSEWQYDVNNHGYKGWFYTKNGVIYWSRGFEGRLIFYKTALEIRDNASSWIDQYIKNKLK
jgi:hypothetical protein